MMLLMASRPHHGHWHRCTVSVAGCHQDDKSLKFAVIARR